MARQHRLNSLFRCDLYSFICRAEPNNNREYHHNNCIFIFNWFFYWVLSGNCFFIHDRNNQAFKLITKILKILGIFVLTFLVISTFAIYWVDKVEDTCWKQEATLAFKKYGTVNTRVGIIRVSRIEKDSGKYPLEVVEKDPNGCSFGSNGQTVLQFSFDDRNKLTRIEVFKNYIASNYKMVLIEHKVINRD